MLSNKLPTIFYALTKSGIICVDDELTLPELGNVFLELSGALQMDTTLSAAEVPIKISKTGQMRVKQEKNQKGQNRAIT